MLDRMGLSIKSGWVDDKNRAYIYFTLDEIQGFMNCKHEKAVKMLAELDSVKGIGLIERVKRGLGKPSIIYVKKFFIITEDRATENHNRSQDFRKTEVLTSDNQNSGLPKNRTTDFRKTEVLLRMNNTDKNNTDINQINPSRLSTEDSWEDDALDETPSADRIDSICGGENPLPTKREEETPIMDSEAILRKNIDRERLLLQYDEKRVDGIQEIIREVLDTNRRQIRIAGADIPTASVKARMGQIDTDHIAYVLDCMNEITTPIRNIKAYLLTALYNAPLTMESYYAAKVSREAFNDSG